VTTPVSFMDTEVLDEEIASFVDADTAGNGETDIGGDGTVLDLSVQPENP